MSVEDIITSAKTRDVEIRAIYKNRQISYTDPITSANNASYVYSASGNRIQKTVNSVTEKYILDGALSSPSMVKIASPLLTAREWDTESAN